MAHAPARPPVDGIPADVRARLRHLRLSTRRGMRNQHGSGLHASTDHGNGMEFAQYRAYEPGDALRLVDWKLYARSDRFFVREAERDTPLDIWLLIDTTASMGQSDARRPDWSRLHAARILAACCIELALRQTDRFGLVLAGDTRLQAVPLGTGPRQRDRCLAALHTATAAGHWPDPAALRPLWGLVRARSVLLCLSDLFDPGLVPLLEQMAGSGRDVRAIQILTTEERDFPFQGSHRFRDPETDIQVLADGVGARADFLQRFHAARKALATRLATAGIGLATYMLDQPVDQPLRQLFAPGR